MLKLRALSFSLLFGAATLLTGCFDDVEAPRIKGLAVNPYVVTEAGSQIQGSVEYDTDKASVSFSVSRIAESGAVVDASSDFDFSQSISLGGSPASLGSFKPRRIVDGNYTLAVNVVDDEGNTTTENAPFKIGNVPTETGFSNHAGANVFTLGAQGALEGSFLDVDDFKQYSSDNSTHTKTPTEKSAIDVVLFANGSTLMLYSPRAAADAGLGGIASWSAVNINSTTIVDAGSTPVSTVESAMSLLNGKTSQSAPAVEGHTYALKLSTDNYASLTIAKISGAGTSATATVTILSE
jgi:hypothetical protein